MGYSKQALREANVAAIALMQSVRAQYASDDFPMPISGCVGPRGDGYVPGEQMLPAQAEAYHSDQIDTMLSAGADLITAITMTNSAEAIGIVRAASRRGRSTSISR